MYQTIYIDIVFLTNFLMDYMLLRLVGRFLHLGGSRFRCLASAALGAGFSCLLLYMPVRIVFPVAVLIHGSCAFFMAAFAFRLKRGCLLAKTILAMYLTAFVVGGIYQALETEGTMTGRTFLLFLAGTYGSLYTLTCVAETFRLCRKNIYPVTLIYQGKKQQSYGCKQTAGIHSKTGTSGKSAFQRTGKKTDVHKRKTRGAGKHGTCRAAASFSFVPHSRRERRTAAGCDSYRTYDPDSRKGCTCGKTGTCHYI